MTWSLAVLFALAALLQFAVHAAPDIHDAPLRGNARRIKIAGLCLLCGYLGWAGAIGVRHQPWLLLALLILCLAELASAIARLFPAERRRPGQDRETRHE